MGKRKTDQQYVVYTDELAQQILDRIANGETLTSICREEGMPSYAGVKKWKTLRPDFAAAYKEAREIGFDVLAEDCLAIADTPEVGEIVTEKSDGTVERRTEDMLAHRKLRVWTRLQLLKSWDPKRYGDMIRQEHSGSLSLEAIVSGSFKSGDGSH